MPTLMSTSVPRAEPREAPSSSLTLSLCGVQFTLTPSDHAVQVAYKTNAQGEIVLDLVNFTGSLQVSGNCGSTVTASPSAATGRRSAKVVVEEPNSPENNHHMAIDNVCAMATVTPGQQRLSFQKKTKKTSKKAQQPRKRLGDVSNVSSKKSRTTKIDTEIPLPLQQQSMEIPTQLDHDDEGGVRNLSQTMPSNPTPSPTSCSQQGGGSPELLDGKQTQGESVQEILDRVNGSNDSVTDDDEMPAAEGTVCRNKNSSSSIQESSENGETLDNDRPDAMPFVDNATTTSDSVATSGGYPAPSPRWGHTMAQLKDDRLLIYGGQSCDLDGNPVILSDVHVYNPSQRSWEKPINCRGEARQWHSATFLPERQLLLAFGGETQDATSKNKVTTTDSLKVLDTEIMLWYPPAVSGDVPTGRSGHTATLIPTTNEVVLFGGVKGSKWLNTVTVLDTVRWIWTTPKIQGYAPKPRSYHSATAIPSGNGSGCKLVIFGGNNKTSCFNTVHVLEMTTENDQTVWKWSHPSVQGQGPFPRTGHSATLMEDGKTICFYGGWDPNEEGGVSGEENFFKSSFLLDTEKWVWSKGPKATPGGSGSEMAMDDCGAKRSGHTASIHPETGEVLVFGGRIPGERLAGDFQRLVPGDK